MRDFAELTRTGRSSIPVQARLRRLLEVGDSLGLTSGDTLRVAVETLRALDQRGELQPAINDVLESLEAGRLRTEFREPMNLYVDQSAVSAMAVAVCDICRPNIALDGSESDSPADPAVPVTVGAEPRPPLGQPSPSASEIEEALPWPEQNRDGFPQMTLDVRVWWPGLSEWEKATLTAYVSKSLAFTTENFTMLIEQNGDEKPARANAVWLLKRTDLDVGLPVYELRGSAWEIGDEPHHFRFLVATDSPWCEELREYLATRWVTMGKSPTGPEEFDAEPLGADHPPLHRLVES